MAINRLNPDYPDAGTVQLVPSSVTVGSGSATVNGNGQISFSGVSSVSINGVFSSVYENYRIVINAYGSVTGANQLGLRFRASGSDTSSNYTGTLKFFAAAANTSIDAAYAPSANAGLGILPTNSTDGRLGGGYDITGPFIASMTSITGIATGTNSGAYTGMGFMGFAQTNSTSFDGFSLFAGSGIITGSVSVYGYRN